MILLFFKTTLSKLEVLEWATSASENTAVQIKKSKRLSFLGYIQIYYSQTLNKRGEKVYDFNLFGGYS